MSPDLAPPSRLQHAGVPGRGGEKKAQWLERGRKGERRRWNNNEQTGPAVHNHYTSWYLSVPERKFFLCFWTMVELQPVIPILYLPSLSTGCSRDPPHAGTRRTIPVESRFDTIYVFHGYHDWGTGSLIPRLSPHREGRAWE